MKKFLEIITFGILIISSGAISALLVKNKGLEEKKVQLKTITVVGEAKGQQKTQIAKFSATVNRVNDDKQKAIDEVNENIQKVIEKIKNFGVDEKDIKTQSFNIYQNQEVYYEDGRQKQRMGQWNVSNTVEITLRDIGKVKEMATLLANSEANSVWGPSFYIDEETSIEADLSKQAIDDAKEKAKKISEASGKKLGEIISINENGNNTNPRPLFYEGGGGIGAPIEPGTITVQKQITVVFELEN